MTYQLQASVPDLPDELGLDILSSACRLDLRPFEPASVPRFSIQLLLGSDYSDHSGSREAASFFCRTHSVHAPACLDTRIQQER